MIKINFILFLILLSISIKAQDLNELKKDPTCKQEITGFVKNYKTGEVIPQSIVQLFSNGELITTIETGDDGAFNFNLDCSTRYNINARFENFTISSKIVYTSSKSESKSLDLFLYPTREFRELNTNKYIDVDYIDFETDVDFNSDFAKKELDKVVNIMNKYPEIRISVDVHTDSKGDSNYSLGITKQRADAIVNYLIEKGIATNRLESNGYGDKQLVNQCAKDVKCSEAEHKANRRIEFLVLE